MSFATNLGGFDFLILSPFAAITKNTPLSHPNGSIVSHDNSMPDLSEETIGGTLVGLVGEGGVEERANIGGGVFSVGGLWR